MKKYQKDIIKLSAQEALSRIFDLALPFYEASRLYRIPAKKYLMQRDFDKSNFIDKIKYLKRQGLINSIVEEKEKYFEITKKGIERMRKINIDRITIKKPNKWDGKWRIVIFDINNRLRHNRDLLRNKLLNLDFQKIQESVYVYPYNCTKEIELLSSTLSVPNDVIVMIADIIQGEENETKTIDKRTME